SNPGIARVIFRGYESNPAKFYDRLAGMGFFEPIRSGIAGECTPRIRKLVPKDSRGNNITLTARHLDLARQAYGYNPELPPLFTLSVYNAIANGGKYVRPHLVKGLIDEEGRDSIIPIQYIRDRICSEETARKVRECIKEVVWGEHGTAKLVRDDRVMVVGKTGTAYPVENGIYNKAKRRYAFAGFFPYEEPKYSCIALVLANGGNSANRTSGQVVKNMAVKMYSRGLLDNSSTYSAERKESRPILAASHTFDPKKLSKNLNIERVKKVKSPTPPSSGAVPSVIGYDAPTAVKILEQAGIEVRLRGSGIVRGQSVEAGTPLKKGMTMTLTLKV
ncbi:MAG: PASTA domain-containing protein, partial [Muribaculaceae bacterium]|nr:PASTA domain-containing protein [Muribaculaceae bacterium]